MSSILFSSGTARGGTNLVSSILNVHPQVQMAQDPFMSLWKSLRGALIQKAALKDLGLDSPFGEYYYSEKQLEVMDLIQSSDLDVKFDQKNIGVLKTNLESRMMLSSPLLIEHIEHLKGRSYKKLLDSAIEIIGLAWGAQNSKWLGFNENWAIEFFSPVAKTYPSAKFIVIVRDIRASIASQLKLMEAKLSIPYHNTNNISLIALTLSFARCWRKHVAFATHYQSQKLFKNRLFFLTYEQLISNPERITKKLCDLMKVNYTSKMIDTEYFVSPDGSSPWLPNTNHYDVPQKGIYNDTVDRWKETLPKPLISLIEFVCGPELEMLGYTLENKNFDEFPEAAFNSHVYDHIHCKGWRTDNRNPAMDFGYELLRRNCLKHGITNKELIKKCFLFQELYEKLV